MWREESGVESSFGLDSNPYVMATEYPWLAPWDEIQRAKRVLSVGGSGDVPFFFSQRGADQVTAVDVSRRACFVMELKAACLKEMSWKEFLAFFLADIPRAERFLHSRGASAHLSSHERESLYGRVKRHGPEDSRRFWEKRFASVSSGKSPFEEFLHGTDLFGLHLIPYLNDPVIYAHWAQGAQKVQVLNLSLEAALEANLEKWDLVYASNIFEYVEMEYALQGREEDFRAYVMALSRKVRRSLKAGGVLCWYAYESFESPPFRERVKGLAGAFGVGWTLSTHGVAYGFENISGSRFKNTLIVFQKDGDP